MFGQLWQLEPFEITFGLVSRISLLIPVLLGLLYGVYAGTHVQKILMLKFFQLRQVEFFEGRLPAHHQDVKEPIYLKCQVVSLQIIEKRFLHDFHQQDYFFDEASLMEDFKEQNNVAQVDLVQAEEYLFQHFADIRYIGSHFI